MRGRIEVAVPVHSRLSVTTAEAAVDAAIAELGVTRILSYQAARAIAAGELQIVLEAIRAAAMAHQCDLYCPGPGAAEAEGISGFRRAEIAGADAMIKESTRIDP